MTIRRNSTVSGRRADGAGRNSGRNREGVADRLLFWTIIVDICALALAGGPSPNRITTAIFVLGAVTLTGLLAISRSAQERRPSAALRAVLVMMVMLPALQLIPLPPALWRMLPDGVLRYDVLSLVAAQDAWRPLSLVPLMTAGAVLLAFSFAVLLTAMIALPERRFEQLLIALGLVALVNIGIGIVQAASGGSPRFIARAHHGALLGFFANKNHIGVVIAASLALSAYLVELFPVLRTRRSLWLFAATLLAVICVIPTNSRAGLLLTLTVGLWITLKLVAVGKPWMRVAVAGSGITLAALLSFSPVFDRVYGRFNDVGDDLRWRFIEQSMPLVHSHGLLGAGGGSFRRLFAVNERLTWVKPTFVNEAHNEYLQIVIEYGVFGVAVLVAGVVALAWAGWRSWCSAEHGSLDRRRLEVGAVIVALFMVHSAIDYPLRRPASWGLFAAGCALLLREGSLARSRAGDGRRRGD